MKKYGKCPSFPFLNTFFIIFLLIYVYCKLSWGVPIASNASVITGKVLKYSVLNSALENMQPEKTLYSLVIKVFSSEPASKEEKNFVKTGEKIEIFSHKEIPIGVFNKIIKAKVSLSGDENSRSFWIEHLEVEKKKNKNEEKKSK